MTATVLATYVDGVFRPAVPVDLPNNTQVELIMKTAGEPVIAQSAIGSREAIEAFIQHCRVQPLNTNVGWNGRDELYDRF